MVGPGEHDDTSQTAEALDAPLASFAEADADTAPAAAAAAVATDTVATDTVATDAVATGAVPIRAGRRRASGLVLPVVVFVVLLAAGAVIGRYVVPGAGRDQTPDAAASPTPVLGAGGAPTASPTLPPLPTPPARPADALAPWAGQIGQILAVPEVAIQAYGYAQLELRRTDPACNLAWTTLAGIGEVESHHGQASGAVLEQGGRSSPAIVGPLLDGQDGRPLVRDTDAGAFDGDATYDRAMGPLRLMPSMWRAQAIDADADGILDPYDIDDAALALARLLCSGNEDLNKLADWTAAVTRYHSGSTYARSVFRVADDYGQRTRSVG